MGKIGGVERASPTHHPYIINFQKMKFRSLLVSQQAFLFGTYDTIYTQCFYHDMGCK